ncbi:PKD domain-containing protein, partial [Runella sp.]|uniref:PKD domain-containing protein n=1 Tax=Runella sp. TaxID=1960881 RepID=UPI00301B3B58
MKKTLIFSLFILLTNWMQAAAPKAPAGHHFKVPIAASPSYGNHPSAFKLLTDCEASFETAEIDSLSLQFTSYFEAIDSAAAVSWLWDFGDGNTSDEENPAHTYDTAGIYEVTLTIVSATGCEATVTEHVC